VTARLARLARSSRRWHRDIRAAFGDNRTMATRIFFSFDYARDVSRVQKIRELPDVIANAPAGFESADLWNETERQGDDAVHALIDAALRVTKVTVVCIGSATAQNKYVDYEIQQSIARGNGIVGVRIHGIAGADGRTDVEGPIPTLLIENWYDVHTYSNQAALAAWIDEAARDRTQF
jgi:hypothetical protein